MDRLGKDTGYNNYNKVIHYNKIVDDRFNKELG